jgi:hypothetical protein
MKPSMMEKLWSVAASCVLVADFFWSIWAICDPRTSLLDCFRDAIASPTTDSRRIVNSVFFWGLIDELLRILIEQVDDDTPSHGSALDWVRRK